MPLTPTKKIWLDGEFVDWDKAQVHVLSHCMHYGSGVFEGIRAYETSRGAAVFRLTDHIVRLFDSAKALGAKRLVVTECGHAYDALRWTAHNMMDVPVEVTHIVAVIDDLVKRGKIKLRAGAYDNGGTITFHDACKIQRRGGHIQALALQLHVGAVVVFFEDAVFFLEVEQRARGDRHHQLVVQGQGHGVTSRID